MNRRNPPQEEGTIQTSTGSEEKAQRVVPGWKGPETLSRRSERSRSLTGEWGTEKGSRLQTATPTLSPRRLHTPSQKTLDLRHVQGSHPHTNNRLTLRKKMKNLAGWRLLGYRLQRCVPSTYCGSSYTNGKSENLLNEITIRRVGK